MNKAHKLSEKRQHEHCDKEPLTFSFSIRETKGKQSRRPQTHLRAQLPFCPDTDCPGGLKSQMRPSGFSRKVGTPDSYMKSPNFYTLAIHILKT